MGIYEKGEKMTEAMIPVVNTVISSGISLLVAFGTWHVTMKKDREKQVEQVKEILNEHREEYLSGIRDVKDDVSQVQATMQNQTGIIELKLNTLSERVDKHNNLVERMYHLEESDAVRQEQIRILAGNIDSMKHGG